nr:RNA-directed DNA polymerase, eukaryota [Tanacetum cinerariifolium]
LAALAVTAEFRALALGTTISVTGFGVFAAVAILERITSIFNGFWIDNSLTISHLFYADDAVFIGDWSNGNLKGILNILNCFSLLSGMSINLKKSQILGMGISDSVVTMAAKDLGCSVMKVPFMYLGVMAGGNMSLVKDWDSTIDKLLKRLSKWKLKTLSICVPKTVLNKMENLRRNFFNGIQEGDRKIAWVMWHTVLASKQYGGLGVSSFFAINRDSTTLVAAYPSIWSSIINEFNSLIDQGVDIFSHCKIRIGNGVRTRFWKDYWLGDSRLQGMFPRLYALESNKDITVAEKLLVSLVYSFRRDVRGGAKTQQCNHLSSLLDPINLSISEDRWVCDLRGDGDFRVKYVRNLLDEFFLPKTNVPTWWVKFVPIKINIFAWKMVLNRLPTRLNLVKINVVLDSEAYLLCDSAQEDVDHVFFSCSLAKALTRLICRWWNLDEQIFSSYSEWLTWLNSLRLGAKLKNILEGVFYVTWWSV